MSEKRSSYLIATMSLVALLVVAIAIAGCTSNGTNAPAGTPAATAVPTAVMTASSETPVVTPAVTAAPTAPVQKQTIKISGSTTILPIVQKAADQYMAAHPEADIQVTGGASGVGISQIGGKITDIGMTSRDVTAAEMAKYPDFVITTIAQDGIAVIVNPVNTIQYITLDQVQGIYTGKITKWNQITGADVPGTNDQIVVVGRDLGSGTRTYFESVVLPVNVTPINSMLSFNSNGAVEQSVQQTPGAIGYVSIGFLTPDTKAVPIWYNADKIIPPTVANVKDMSYPMSRNLYLITNGKPTGLTADFINYILSPDGQKIVADEGYVPLS